MFAAAHYIVEPWLYRIEVRRRRKELATIGLTPSRYLATIPERDLMRRARAMVELGIDENGRDDREFNRRALRLVLDSSVSGNLGD